MRIEMRKQKPQEADIAEIIENLKYRFSQEDRLNQHAEYSFDHFVKGFKKIVKDAKNHLPTSNVQTIKRLIEEYLPKFLRTVVEDAITSKSIWQLAMENGIPFKKLLYELREIGFPMSRMKRGRRSNRISGDHLELFNYILPSIKAGIYCEQTKKEWIRLFKRMGWEKSRISKFMQRRVAYKLVPNHFFDCLLPTQEWILKILNNERIENLSKLDYGREGVRDLARAMIAESKKTLLTTK